MFKTAVVMAPVGNIETHYGTFDVWMKKVLPTKARRPGNG
jgi:hypothetical protein